jgi:hypothetical protein
MVAGEAMRGLDDGLYAMASLLISPQREKAVKFVRRYIVEGK